MLVQCRMEQRALNAACKNVKDVSKKLDLVFDFLTGMQSQLLAIDSKLSSLQSDVTAMREELRRLTGKPVLEVYREWADKTIKAQTKELQKSVYIEALVCGAGEKEDFVPNETDNKAEKITKAFKEFFETGKKAVSGAPVAAVAAPGVAAGGAGGAAPATLPAAAPSAEASGAAGPAGPELTDGSIAPVKAVESDAAKAAPDDEPLAKEVLLLTGQAGSGKSTAVTKLINYVLTDYTQKRLVEGITVILLPVSLPNLNDPLGKLFEEGALQAYDRALRQSQVDELREMLKDKEKTKLELILLLDAYDELAPNCQGKNLYRSNNLELYHPHKVVVTSRSELFSDCKKELQKYQRHFYPIDINDKNRDEELEAKEFFIEKV